MLTDWYDGEYYIYRENKASASGLDPEAVH
jgi:hypothetical protein